MKTFVRDNGLTIVLTVMFLASLVGMVLTGHAHFGHQLAEHGLPGLSVFEYMLTGDFVSAVFENWESEFLQMAVYVILTAVLFQKGSAESRDPDEPEREHDALSGKARRVSPVRSFLYSHSLGLVLTLLFAVSFVLHWIGSTKAANAEQLMHGRAAKTFFQYIGDSQLWFECFQNWQSEFLSTGVLVVLSIFLRQQGSPESKPVAARNDETGA